MESERWAKELVVDGISGKLDVDILSVSVEERTLPKVRMPHVRAAAAVAGQGCQKSSQERCHGF